MTQKIYHAFFITIFNLAFWGCESANNRAAKAANKAAIAAYETDFSDPSILDEDWVVENGDWKIEDGALIGEGYAMGNVGIWLNKPLSDNIEIEYEISGVANNDLNCIIAGNGKSWSGYPVIVGGLHGTKCRIAIAEIRNDDEVHHERLGEAAFEPEANRKYRVTVRRTPEMISLSIDGEEILRSDDTNFAHDLDNQYFGFYTWDNKVSISRLTIKPTDSDG